MEDMGVEEESGVERKKLVKITIKIGAIIIGIRHFHVAKSLFPFLDQDGGTGDKIEVNADKPKEAPSCAPNPCGSGIKKARVKFVEKGVQHGIGKKIRLIDKPPCLDQGDTTPCSTHHIGDDPHKVSFESEKTNVCDELLKEAERYQLPKYKTNTKVLVTTKLNSKKTPSSHSRILKKLRSMGTKNKRHFQATRMISTRCPY